MTVDSLASRLVGSWELVSRIDRTRDGEQRAEPSLGSDPFGFLGFDRAGHFAAQFMKRDRAGPGSAPIVAGGLNNSRARDGYDAYFGKYTVDDDQQTVQTELVGALSTENVGQVFTRTMMVEGEILTLELDTMSVIGEPLKRTLRWRRVS
jgi:hypothetical protein